MSLMEIKCPMCKGQLWIDPSNGKVVDHRSVDHQKADFDRFMKERKEAAGQWDDRMKKAKEEEARRKAELEEKFKAAREDPDSLDGDVPTIQWD